VTNVLETMLTGENDAWTHGKVGDGQSVVTLFLPERGQLGQTIAISLELFERPSCETLFEDARLLILLRGDQRLEPGHTMSVEIHRGMTIHVLATICLGLFVEWFSKLQIMLLGYDTFNVFALALDLLWCNGFSS
jgi:hypothetical protein